MSINTQNYTIQPNGPLHGHVRVPGDKSISHRAVILASLAEGVSEIKGFLASEDCLATVRAFQAMGVTIETLAPEHLRIHGVGLNGLKAPNEPLDLGNSGTALRLLTGIMSAQPFDCTLTGDDSLQHRPMKRIADPLEKMGAVLTLDSGNTAPITIEGGHPLEAIHYNLPMASAQVKSCLLLAGLYAQGDTELTEPAHTRDHTERMLRAFGCTVYREAATIHLPGHQTLTATNLSIPGDMSAAAFFLVAATITEGSELLLEHVGFNPSRIGLINILRLMGAKITVSTEDYSHEEPFVDIRVQSAPLRGIDIPLDEVASAIDEFPALFIAAACAKGVTCLRGAEELRVKESDRIMAMANGLRALGIHAESLPDGMIIKGGQLKGGRVNSYQDHRIAMAFSLAGLVAESEVIVEDCARIATSFPTYLKLARHMGMDIRS